MSDYDKEDISHIDEVPQSKNSGASSDAPYVYPSAVNTGTRWGRCKYVRRASIPVAALMIFFTNRAYFQEPPIPAGEFITRYPNRWSRIRYVVAISLAAFPHRLPTEKSFASLPLSSSEPWFFVSLVSVRTARSPSAPTRVSLGPKEA